MNPDRAARLTGAVDRGNSERLLLIPLRPGRYTDAQADPERQTLAVVGVVIESIGVMRVNDSAVGRDFNTQVATAPIGVFVAVGQLAGAAFKRDDRIQRLELPGQPAIGIVQVDATGAGRVVFRCVRIAP